jgi:hypothetical protein
MSTGASSDSTVTGSSNNILSRVKRLIPNRWFKFAAPYRDAVLGGLSDSAAWNYGLILYARAQTRLATAYGVWLDILAFDFLGRALLRNNVNDDIFRATIRATILQERVTRNGMISAMTALTGNVPVIFEPWNTFDTGAYSGIKAAGGVQYGSMGYGVGRGGWGNMNLPGQVFMQVGRGVPAGIPNVGGYGSTVDGYGVGQIEYSGPLLTQVGITDALINQVITQTRPTGTTAWVAIEEFAIVFGLTSESGGQPLLTDELGPQLTSG